MSTRDQLRAIAAEFDTLPRARKPSRLRESAAREHAPGASAARRRQSPYYSLDEDDDVLIQRYLYEDARVAPASAARTGASARAAPAASAAAAPRSGASSNSRSRARPTPRDRLAAARALDTRSALDLAAAVDARSHATGAGALGRHRARASSRRATTTTRRGAPPRARPRAGSSAPTFSRVRRVRALGTAARRTPGERVLALPRAGTTVFGGAGGAVARARVATAAGSRARARSRGRAADRRRRFDRHGRRRRSRGRSGAPGRFADGESPRHRVHRVLPAGVRRAAGRMGAGVRMRAARALRVPSGALPSARVCLPVLPRGGDPVRVEGKRRLVVWSVNRGRVWSPCGLGACGFLWEDV